jgi:hypothetical protein
MSAPLVVNTQDGMVWLRRAATRGGVALYAPQDVCQCPEFVMATYAELEGHGIAGQADALPMPVGPVLRSELDRLRARVAELEAQRERRRVRLVALQNDALNMRGALSPNGERRKVPMPLGDTLTPAVEWLLNRVAELEAWAAAEECCCPEPAPLCEGCRCKCHTEQAKESADKLTRRNVPLQALREDEPADPCHPCGCPKRFERHADGCPTLPAEADRIVAYRNPKVSRVLLCREHGPRYVGMVPVTAEDLPDGGSCTFGRLSSLECGRDVLIDEPQSGGAS